MKMLGCQSVFYIVCMKSAHDVFEHENDTQIKLIKHLAIRDLTDVMSVLWVCNSFASAAPYIFLYRYSITPAGIKSIMALNSDIGYNIRMCLFSCNSVIVCISFCVSDIHLAAAKIGARKQI